MRRTLRRRWKRGGLWLTALLVGLSLAACELGGWSGLPRGAGGISAAAAPPVSAAVTETETPFLPEPATLTPTASRTPTVTRTPRHSPTPSSSPTPENTPTPAWDFHPAGELTAPVLLYHHVNDQESNLYTVTTTDFRNQMKVLAERGYTTIPISLLVRALRDGAPLPPKPLVITFDDGNRDVYTRAYPILQEFGFTASVYLVVNYLERGESILSHEQIDELLAAGWEFGSHSMSHTELTRDYGNLWYEVSRSRYELEEYLGTDVITFAYPYGVMDAVVQRSVRETFEAGLGLGSSSLHTPDSLYYLSRIEVRRTTSLADFKSLIP